MKIAGIQKCSMVDYPGHLAAVVFTSGCNWNCFYCHNRGIIGGQPASTWWDAEIALGWFDERRDFLDGVVITGGEPTLQPGLTSFIRDARVKGLKIKLDTNGTRPEVLASLLNERLLDYVAMDIKAPMEKYEAFCGVPVDHKAINRSIDLLLDSDIDYEFRTTAVPQLTESDILAIARRIRGARKFVLQQYRRVQGVPSDLVPHPPQWPARLMDDLHQIVTTCQTRGFDLPQQNTRSSAA